MSLVKLIRRVSFSSGHRYWLADKAPEDNRRLFGKFASPFNHGHNYVLDVTCEGPVDAKTGMVVNIKDIDDVLQNEVVGKLDGKSLNDEIDAFRTTPPTLENILLFFRSSLERQIPGGARLTELRLEEMPTLWANLSLPDNAMTLTRSYEFAASHRLHSPHLDDAKNVELYGKCNNPSGHGHNYILEVTVSGQLDQTTGMMVDMVALDDAVNAEVVDRYDHKHLNSDVPEFADVAPTSEVIAAQIWKRLEGAVPGKLRKIRLYETARSAFEIEAS